jgi:hypothetical protein
MAGRQQQWQSQSDLGFFVSVPFTIHHTRSSVASSESNVECSSVNVYISFTPSSPASCANRRSWNWAARRFRRSIDNEENIKIARLPVYYVLLLIPRIWHLQYNSSGAQLPTLNRY